MRWVWASGSWASAIAFPPWRLLGFAGALLHVMNHALFKSLLFLGAGAVQHSTGTRDIDRLGGLLKTDAGDREPRFWWVRVRFPGCRR